jgi:hypothetical protein
MIGPSRGGRRASGVKTFDGRCGDEVKQGAILRTPERVPRIFYLEEKKVEQFFIEAIHI